MLKIRWGRHREPLVGNEVCSIEGRPVKICRSFARAGPRHTWLSAGDNGHPHQCVPPFLQTTLTSAIEEANSREATPSQQEAPVR
jgi:hypothetical protein